MFEEDCLKYREENILKVEQKKKDTVLGAFLNRPMKDG